MKGNVKFTPPSTISFDLDWKKGVDDVHSSGHIKEAFSNADAIIDNTLEFFLRTIYNSFESQDLINELHRIRGRIPLYGLQIAEILKSKKALGNDGEKIYQQICQFKKARDLVLHTVEGEYSLVIGNSEFKVTSQEDLEKFVESEIKIWLGFGFDIFLKLNSLLSEANKNRKYFFSREFYEKNPRGQNMKNKFPSKAPFKK